MPDFDENERRAMIRDKRDTKLMLHRLKGKLPEDLRVPTVRYHPSTKERTERWRRLLKTQTGKGFGIEDSSSNSSSDSDSDDAANLGYNYRSLPTFEDSSGSGDEDDYFDTPEDNFFPIPNKYRLGPKRLLKLQQNMRTSSASRRFYSNLGDDVLKWAGLMPTVPMNSTPTPLYFWTMMKISAMPI